MMWHVPSVAIGTVQPQARLEPVVWGLTGALARAGLSVQAFAGRTVPDPRDAIARLTGRPLKHLDSWVQDRQETIAAMHRAASDCQSAVVFGAFDRGSDGMGGDFAALCQRLSLPRIAVVDLSQVDGCRIPPRPAQLAGILLDRVSSARTRIAWQTMLEALWDAPVLGWLDDSLPARTLIDYLPDEQTPSCDCLAQLADSLSQTIPFDRLLAIAQRCPWLPSPDVPSARGLPPAVRRMSVRVAVAFDEAFPCYSADTLEMLEAAGACVRDFSPLKSEQIPEGTDVVLLGTGTHDRHWPELARNCCLQQSLRNFAAAGGRVYAEGSGLAYLSRQVVLANGRRIPLSGVLPVLARKVPAAERYEAARLTTCTASWLFGGRQELRGYRQTDWEIEPTGPVHTYAMERSARLDLLARGNVIGSRIVLHFASRPALLERFLSPFAPLHSLAVVDR